MIRPGEQFFSYTLVRCADPDREEHLNVGVVVYDQHQERTLARFDSSLDRVTAAFPHLPHSHIRMVLNDAEGAFASMVKEGGVESLERAAIHWDNLIRLSKVRSIKAASPEAALDQVYQDSVGLPDLEKPQRKPSRQPTVNYTSRQVINGFTRRFRARGFNWDEMKSNAQVEGIQRDGREVPVWFPLMIKRTHLFDAFDASGEKEQDSWEKAMLVSRKTEETLRTGRYKVAVTIRELGESDLMHDLAHMIESEGAANGLRPTVFSIRSNRELDAVVGDLGDLETGNLFEDQ